MVGPTPSEGQCHFSLQLSEFLPLDTTKIFQRLTERVESIAKAISDKIEPEAKVAKLELVGLAAAITGVKVDITRVKTEANLVASEVNVVTSGFNIFKVEETIFDLQEMIQRSQRLAPDQLDMKIQSVQRQATVLRSAVAAVQAEARSALICCRETRTDVNQAKQRADEAMRRAGQAKSIAEGAKGRADRAMRDLRELHDEASSSSGAIKRLRHDVEKLNDALR